MFKQKMSRGGLASNEQRFFLVQAVATIISEGDLTLRQREKFFDSLNRLEALSFTTHEHTKNNVSHIGLTVSDYEIPLIFLAVIYNRKEIFKALIAFFNADIADLKDGMPAKKGNILHHMYGLNSLADEVMQKTVFECLEKQYSKDKILAMIDEKDKRDLSVLDYAHSYGYGLRDLIDRIASYECPMEAEQSMPVEGASAAHHSYSLFPITRTTAFDAAAILCSMRM